LTHVSDDPLELSNTRVNGNMMFNEFVTNLRGFDYNELFGNSVFLLNAELRIPVFRYFSRAPITSNFFRNFMLTGFFDFGSAWTGPIPLSLDRSSNAIRYEVPGSPFSASLNNFRNPWLATYGLGLRTVLLGYYAKLDYTFLNEDWVDRDFAADADGDIRSSRITISIGLDF
jgi:outer membrane protein assembly factor BamA